MSNDLKYQKGKWYHVQEDGSLKPVGNETAVMMYLNILKYAKHHCPEDEDPYEITDRIFTDMFAANKASN